MATESNDLSNLKLEWSWNNHVINHVKSPTRFEKEFTWQEQVVVQRSGVYLHDDDDDDDDDDENDDASYLHHFYWQTFL